MNGREEAQKCAETNGEFAMSGAGGLGAAASPFAYAEAAFSCHFVFFVASSVA